MEGQRRKVAGHGRGVRFGRLVRFGRSAIGGMPRMLMKRRTRCVSSSLSFSFLFPLLFTFLPFRSFPLFFSLLFSLTLPFSFAFALSFPFPLPFTLPFPLPLPFFFLLPLSFFSQLMAGYRRSTAVMRRRWRRIHFHRRDRSGTHQRC